MKKLKVIKAAHTRKKAMASEVYRTRKGRMLVGRIEARLKAQH